MSYVARFWKWNPIDWRWGNYVAPSGRIRAFYRGPYVRIERDL